MRGASWVNQCNTPTSVCSFVDGVLHELPPSNIRDAAVDCLVAAPSRPPLHLFDSELFKSDELVFVDQLARFLVSKVIAPMRSTFVGVTKCLDDLAPLWTSFRKAFFLALQTGNVGGVLLHPALPLNGLSIAEISKRGQAKVNADDIVVGWQRLSITLAGEAGVPIANRVTLNGQGLNVGADGAMQLNRYITDLGNAQPVAYQLKTRLLEGETIVQALALKAWVSWLLASFDTAKECLKSKVNPLLHILQDLGMNRFQGWFFGFPLCQKLVGIVQAQRLTILLVGVFTRRQRVIVDPSAKLKHFGEACSLGRGWIKAVLVCQSHRCILAYLTLIVNDVKESLF